MLRPPGSQSTTRWLLHSRLNVLWAGVLHSFRKTFAFWCTKIGYHQRISLRFQLFGKPETQAVSWTPKFLHMLAASVLRGLLRYAFECLQSRRSCSLLLDKSPVNNCLSNLHDEAVNNCCCLVGTFGNPLSRTPVRSHLSILINPVVQCWPVISSARSSVIQAISDNIQYIIVRICIRQSVVYLPSQYPGRLLLTRHLLIWTSVGVNLNAYNLVDHVLFCMTCLHLTVSNLDVSVNGNRCCLVGTIRNPQSRTLTRSYVVYFN